MPRTLTPLTSYSPGVVITKGLPPTMARLLWPGWACVRARTSAENLLGTSVVRPRPLPYGSMTTLASRPRRRKQAWPTKLISINSSCRPGGGGDTPPEVLAGPGLHPLRGRHAHQPQQVSHRLPGRLAEEQPGLRQLAVLDHHPEPRVLVAGMVEGVDPLRQALAVVGQVVRG